jgi:hypothetical protein
MSEQRFRFIPYLLAHKEEGGKIYRSHKGYGGIGGIPHRFL